MDDLPDVECPVCSARYTVIWSYSLDTLNGPEFCPFCGAEWDYSISLGERYDAS
jgi:uncharacterized Zn-finger protein